MLQPSKLATLKDSEPITFLILRELVEAVNLIGSMIGIDPRPAPQADPKAALPAPPPPLKVTLTTSGALDFVEITPHPNHDDWTQYFIEGSTSPTFDTVKTIKLGSSWTGMFSVTGTNYVRAYAKKPMTAKSAYVYAA